MSDDTKQTSRGHSSVGASSADRWMNCPASVSLSDSIPYEEVPSIHALEGTCAHELAEATLKGTKNCMDYVGQEWCGITVTEEMAEYVQTYVDYVLKASSGEGKELIIEEMFDLSFIREGMFGSNDAIVLEFMGTLEVIDLKYGKGKEVQAKNNPQLMYYALGASYGQDFDKVKMTIIQPRIKDPIKSHVISYKELLEFGDILGEAVDRTREVTPEMKLGDHCFFCKAKSICPLQLKQAEESIMTVFKNDMEDSRKELPLIPNLTDDQLTQILEKGTSIKSWIDSVYSYAENVLKTGGVVKGYKLVEKRTNRRIKDEKEIELLYGDKIYTKKLKNLTELTKVIGKKEIESFLEKPQGELTIAHESDKRLGVSPTTTMASVFGIENKQEEDFSNLTF